VEKAWELLSYVDQIHVWGVTCFRNFVIQHLKSWHAYGEECYENDAVSMGALRHTGRTVKDAITPFQGILLPLPKWTSYFTEEAKKKFKAISFAHRGEAFTRYWGRLSRPFSAFQYCGIDECYPGIHLTSKKMALEHFRDVHGMDSDELVLYERCWGGGALALEEHDETYRIYDSYIVQSGNRRLRVGSLRSGRPAKRRKT
jgi:hypothetical protein